MIKKFSENINEDYFSKLANRKDSGDKRKENELTEELVMSYFSDMYFEPIIYIRKRNGKTVVDVDGTFYLKEDTEKIPFQFGIVSKHFNCSRCRNLQSLEGCPEEVDGDFFCDACESLVSLKGAPEYIGGSFDCTFCKNLTSLEGCPKEIGNHFKCQKCGKKFTENDVQSLCNVKGRIFV